MTKARPFLRVLCAALTLLLWLGLVLAPRVASADDIPPRTGEVVDPSHLLRRRDRDDLRDKLKKLKKDFKVELLVWLVDGSGESVESLGRPAYEKWNVGNGADTGVLLIVPRKGAAVLVEPKGKEYFFPWERKSIRKEDRSDVQVGDRAFAIEHAIEQALRKKTVHRRPRGVTRPRRGMVYLLLASGVAMLAFFLSFTFGDRRVGAPA